MELSNAELLVIKAELTNDPLDLGLTILEADDSANAEKLNEVREDILRFRASVPADSINIPIDEFSSASEGQREWWAMQTADGSVNPAVIESEFYKMFDAGTAARTSFDSVKSEPSSRAIQLLDRYIVLTPSDISNARNAV